MSNVSGVMPASVSRASLGSEAITWLRSTNPGSVRPTSVSSLLAARTPLMATKAICIGSLGGYLAELRVVHSVGLEFGIPGSPEHVTSQLFHALGVAETWSRERHTGLTLGP